MGGTIDMYIQKLSHNNKHTIVTGTTGIRILIRILMREFMLK